MSCLARYTSQVYRAKCMYHFDVPYELVGGTPEGRAAAAEWCAMFAPEVVFTGTPQRNPVSAFAA